MAVNGRIPTGELVFVGNDVDGQPAYLHKGAAADWFAMKAACLKETGVTLTISGGGGAYRTFALQEYYYDQYRNHGGANAAYPGTSNHGWGKAIDIYNWSRAYGWLLENCGRWGFENNYSPEGWHYQHLSDTSVAPAVPATSGEVAPQPRSEEETMFIKAIGKTHHNIPTGWMFERAQDGKLMALSKEERTLVEQRVKAGLIIVSEWEASDIYNHELKSGLWEFTGSVTGDDPGFHTGRLLFGMPRDGDDMRRLPGQLYPKQ